MTRALIQPGERHARLVAIGRFDKTRDNAWRWTFACDCGRETIAIPKDVRNGNKKSCGCLAREATVATGHANKKHGLRNTPEYRAWQAMLNRCKNPRVVAYPNYGGRGITVCERWQSFESFYSDIGPRPSPEHSLDRIDNDGNYEPSNCGWSLDTQQNRNRRNSRMLLFQGRTVSMAELAEITNVDYDKLRDRVRRGVDIDLAVASLSPLNLNSDNSQI